MPQGSKRPIVLHTFPRYDEYRGAKLLRVDLPLPAKVTDFAVAAARIDPNDFELLTDLIFSASVWRRQTSVGGSMANIDFAIRLPTTQELAYVQVKSRSDSQTLNDVIRNLDAGGAFDRLFFVYHTGELQTDDERVVLIGPKELAEQIIDAGMINWLVQRAKPH